MNIEQVYRAVRTMRRCLEAAVKFSEDFGWNAVVFHPREKHEEFRQAAVDRHHAYFAEFREAVDLLIELDYPISMECRAIAALWENRSLTNPQICFSSIPRTQEIIGGRRTEIVWVLGTHAAKPEAFGATKTLLLTSMEYLSCEPDDDGPYEALLDDQVILYWKHALAGLHVIEQRLYETQSHLQPRAPSMSANGKIRVGALHDKVGCTSATIRRYAALAGVPTPSKGQSNHQYTMAQVRQILESMRDGAAKTLAARARALLDEMEKELINGKEIESARQPLA